MVRLPDVDTANSTRQTLAMASQQQQQEQQKQTAEILQQQTGEVMQQLVMESRWGLALREAALRHLILWQARTISVQVLLTFPLHTSDSRTLST
jgi:hypothetical protein